MTQAPEWIKNILETAANEAASLGNAEITPDHLFLAIVENWMNEACETLEANGIDCQVIKREMEDKMRSGSAISQKDMSRIKPLSSLGTVIGEMLNQARILDEETNPMHLLLAILLANDNITSSTLREKDNLDYGRLLAMWKKAKKKSVTSTFEGESAQDQDFHEDENGTQNQGGHQGAKKENSSTPNLDKYGYDLTKAARAEKLDPVVGRETEIERLSQILGRRRKNSPILIGEAGVGKSAIAEGLAIRIAEKQVPRALLNKRIVTLDIGSLVAGTQYRGQFEERVKQVLEEIKHNPDVIIFIDELHTLVGAGGAPGSLDAADMLKPALARGEIQCIGATTTDEFRKIIEKDRALERRFQKIMVFPTTFEQTLAILQTIKGRYEKHHNVKYSPAAITACITLSQRYITDRSLPDKAIDVLDEVGSRVHLRFSNFPPQLRKYNVKIEKIREAKREAATDGDFERAASLKADEDAIAKRRDKEMEEWSSKSDSKPHEVTEEDVAQVISEMTNILVSKIAASESDKLINMAANLKKRIIGQDDAVDNVVRAIHRNRAGLNDPGKPIGTFLFLGPTGVGKTQLAKVLAEYMFDSADNLIRIDMSEYMERIAITRLTGAPPGYVGYDEGGQLSEAVRRKPYSVVLLDEIEKAHSDVFNLLLQVLDEGRLTDANGNLIDFRNTILIMTSNVGSMELKDFGEGLGFATPSQNRNADRNAIINKALKRKFAPEFLNRLDGIVIFNSLTRENIMKIVDIELADLFSRVSALGYNLQIPKEVKQFLTDVGFDPRYGARPLKRAIQHYIEDPLAEFIISPEKNSSRNLRIVLTDDAKDTAVETFNTQEPKRTNISKVPKARTAKQNIS
ncbi:MAG: ATP-dependent Clp protease ATP-binding subunit [Bacteroidales bacterium]|jgi:ATP-dependent Clp protease ATP-binding subunit ClpC|nr:ATP-dependent Clp protease ATP-binding subunit [Bacteroidales bacterium]MCI2145361.1 ATP-dependent Clp protease ATP-binding subunit [Bacteroidales bacterium]